MTVETIKLGGDKFKIVLERETLLVLARCIQEARSKIEDWEFHTLTGGTPAAADDMRAMFLKAAEGIPDAGT